MKFLFSLLTLVLITKECNHSKSASLSETEENANNITQSEDMFIVYTIQSRGLFEEVIISNATIKTKNGRDDSNETSSKIDAKDWAELTKLVSILPIEKLTSLAAPTDKRIYDGAAMATLKLTLDSKEIETPTFDHGYPPKAIEALVNKVLSIKENVVKD